MATAFDHEDKDGLIGDAEECLEERRGEYSGEVGRRAGRLSQGVLHKARQARI